MGSNILIFKTNIHCQKRAWGVENCPGGYVSMQNKFKNKYGFKGRIDFDKTIYGKNKS